MLKFDFEAWLFLHTLNITNKFNIVLLQLSKKHDRTDQARLPTSPKHRTKQTITLNKQLEAITKQATRSNDIRKQASFSACFVRLPDARCV